MARREKFIRVRLTADQMELLHARCDEAGIPVSSWCRYLVIGDEKVEPLPRQMISAVDKATLLELNRHQEKILMVDRRFLSEGHYSVETWQILTEIASSIIAISKLISEANTADKLSPSVKIFQEKGEYTHYIGIRVTKPIYDAITQSLKTLNISMSDYIRARILSMIPCPMVSLSTEVDLLSLRSLLPKWDSDITVLLKELRDIQGSIFDVLRVILNRNEQVIYDH